MSKVKKGIGKGLSNMEKLEGILTDIAKDLKSIKASFDAHVHITTAAIKASGTVTIADVPSANDTVTVGGQTYKFVDLPAAANDIKIGADVTACALNLKKAINGEEKTDEYGDGTIANVALDASVEAGVITLTCKTAGEAGNALTIAVNGGARITKSGNTLTGGAYAITTEEVTAEEKFEVLTVEDN